MAQGISLEQFKILSAPFASQDHEFKPPRNYIYISEEAICKRIEQVDLSWEWRVETVNRYDPKGAIATTIGHLTICGVTRGGEGSQAVEFQKGSDTESGEAEKGSETDALKRAARKFGIGRYLLQCPKTVTGYGAELDKWLRSIAKEQGVSQPSVDIPLPTPSTSDAPVWWKDVLTAMRTEEKMTDTEFDKLRQIVKASLDKTPLRGMNAMQAKAFIKRELVGKTS